MRLKTCSVGKRTESQLATGESDLRCKADRGMTNANANGQTGQPATAVQGRVSHGTAGSGTGIYPHPHLRASGIKPWDPVLQTTAQGLGSPTPMWDTRTEFWAPGFDLEPFSH